MAAGAAAGLSLEQRGSVRAPMTFCFSKKRFDFLLFIAPSSRRVEPPQFPDWLRRKACSRGK
jgi:hypothetical protein